MARGKGDTFKKTNKSKCTPFFLPLSDLLTMQLLQSCKQYLNAFQSLSLKMSRKKKGGTVWQECYGGLPLLFGRSSGRPRDTHVIAISHPVCSVFQRLCLLSVRKRKVQQQ